VTTPLRIALALVLCAAALWLGIVQPETRRAGALADDYRRARNEQARQHTQLERLERQIRQRERAATLLGSADAARPGLAAVRRRVLAATTGVALSALRLDVRAALPPAAATLKVEASGRFLDLVALTTQLVRPGSGVVLESVRLAPDTSRGEQGSNATLSLEGDALGGQP
jgi:hypothetical protein